MEPAIAAGFAAPREPPRLAALVSGLTGRYVRLWRETGDQTPVLGPRIGRWRQLRNYRDARRLVDRLAAAVEEYPDEPARQRSWRERVREVVQRFGERRLGWPAGYRDLLCADEFFDSTVEFVRRARAFDPEVSTDDLGQALRNVWIVNSLQMLLELPVLCSPAVFAYSMLYPATDNYLDDPAVPALDKRRFNARLRRRLAGSPEQPRHRRERQVFTLVEIVERQYDRRRFPQVFESLLAIHHAQTGSLEQQRPGLSDAALLAASVEKGGTSVLADGYLAAGGLSRAEADFCFGYGVALQLLDDLQDAAADREAGHLTLFSRAFGSSALDSLTSRLHRFLCRVLDGSERLSAARCEPVRDLIRRNCTFLLVAAVSDAPGAFTPDFRSALERHWTLRLSALRRLKRHVRRRYGRTARRLRRRRGTGSLLDLLE